MLEDENTAIRESGLPERRETTRPVRWLTWPRVIFALFFLCPSGSITPAQSWTQPAGRGQIIGTVTFKSITFGEAADRSGGRRTNVAEFSPFVEYGATDWLTLIAQPRAQLAWRDAERQGGYGETDVGARLRLWSGSDSVLSVQALARLPASTPRFGDTGFGADVRAVYGTNATLFGAPAFVVAEAGYRRFSDREDQWVGDLTLGVRPSVNWMVLAQSFNRFATSFSAAQGKVQLSVVHRLTDRLSLQVGGYATAYAREADRESGVLAALWYRF